MDKTQKTQLLAAIILIGFSLAVIYHYIMNFYLKMGEPYGSFLYPASAAFCDFGGAFQFIQNLAPYQKPTLWVVYFPLAYIILLPFIFIKNHILAYSLFISGFFAYYLFMNIKTFSCKNLSKAQNFQNIFIISFMFYPFLYILDKGNFDMFLFVILGFFTWAFKKEKYLLAAFLLAVENAIKPFTVLFLLLFLFKKRLKECFFSVVFSSILVIGGFMFFKGGVLNQMIVLLQSFKYYNLTYFYSGLNDFGMAFGSSLFMPLKLIFCKWSVIPLISTLKLAKIYNIFMSALTLVTIFFVYREKSYWKQLTLLTCNFLLLPYITYDYKLIFLLIPFWLFMKEEKKSRFDLAYLVLFALLFIPKNYLIMLPAVLPRQAEWFSVSIILNPLIMLLLSGLIIFEQFSKKKLSEENDARGND